ncbi:MAG: GAF domain-containing protein, partial [Chloroflexota bacterium]
MPRPDGMFSKMRNTRQPQVWNTKEEGLALSGGMLVPGTAASKSGVFIPIISNDRVIGIVGLENYEREYAFSEADVRLLNTVTASLGAALENAYLFSETERLLKATEQSNAELAIINSLQEGLVSKLDVQAIYELIGEKVREFFKVEILDIVIYDESTHLMSMPYSYEKGDRSVFTPRPPYGFRQEVIQSRMPLLINEKFVEKAAEHNNPLVTGEWPKSALFVPLVVDNKVKGIISIQDLDQENAFSTSDVHLLQTLGNSMSIALEKAFLFDETQRLLNETEQRNMELSIINSMSEGMSKTLEVKSVTQIVGDKMREIFKTDIVSIMLLDKQTNLLHYLYEYDKAEGGMIDFLQPFPLGTGLTSKVIQSRKPLLLNTLEAEIENGAYFPPEALAKSAGSLSKSWLGVPIIANNQAIGVVDLADYREHVFNENHLRLLQTMAANMGVAIENARLFQAEQQRVAELQLITSIQQGLAAKLDFQAIVDLVGDKLREVFHTPNLGISWHEVKTNLIHYLYLYEHGKRL